MSNQDNELIKLKELYLSMSKRLDEMETLLKWHCRKEDLYQRQITAYKDIINNFLMGYRNIAVPSNDINTILKNTRAPMTDINQYRLDEIFTQYNIIFKGRLRPFQYHSKELDFDLCCLFGTVPHYESSRLIAYAHKMHVPIITMEEGFIESVFPVYAKGILHAYRRPYSAVFDSEGIYYYGGSPSRLENILNSDSFSLSATEFRRAKDLIDKIQAEKISKYNYQPIVPINIGKDKEKVLVVDQVWGDQAIKDGLSSDEIFMDMLAEAIRENPNADIIVKTHPVALQSPQKGHYSNIQPRDNIYKIDYPLNPISLLEAVDKVYVCTSQMGFEALLCGKEVHTFGMPFYAGWGMTHDRLVCQRRVKKRSIEEIFYAAYIIYTIYVSYKKHSVCEIEEAIEEILELREEYWKKSD